MKKPNTRSWDVLKFSLFPRDPLWVEHEENALMAYAIGSYGPELPFLAKSDRVACIGSCFAEEISKSLSERGRSTVHLDISERWNTPLALKYFLKNVMAEEPFPEGFIPQSINSSKIISDAKNISSADVFIVTLGLSVYWVDASTGRIVLEPSSGHSTRGLSSAINTHFMQQMPVEVITSEIADIVALIKLGNPGAQIILTLSPIPLLLSLTRHPPLAANAISKAVLRTAIHNIVERGQAFYWPAYEIIEWIGKYRELIWGADGSDLRHLKKSVVQEVMALFDKLYFMD